MTDAQKKQESLPEAASSVTYSLTDKNGFNILFTVRDVSGISMLKAMGEISEKLVEEGYKPQTRSFGGGGFAKATPKPVETVQGRVCPTCRAPLVYFEFKGKKHIKCSTSKYDYKTKTKTGCSYVEWAKDEDKVKQFDEEYGG